MATPKADEVSVLNGLAQLPTSGVGADSIRVCAFGSIEML